MRSKKTITRILCLVFAVMLVVGLTTIAPGAVAASGSYNEAVADDANGILQVRYEIYGTGTAVFNIDGRAVTYDFDNELLYGSAGTCFLINDYTALTCAHVVNHDDIVKRFKQLNLKPEVKMYVLLANNVPMTYTVPFMSVDDDFAIITLKQSIGAKKILKLGDSREVKTTQKVYSLGFPGVVSSVEEENNEFNVKYDTADVTITEGAVQKVTNINNTDVIQHGSSIAGGNSGGPLVDEQGYVIGINKWNTTSKDNYYWATGINQVMNTLDNLKIPYDIGGSEPTVAPETKAEEPTVSPATKAEEPTAEPVTEEPPTTQDSKMGIIIAIIALVAVLVIVLVVVIILSSKKKNNNNNNNLPPTPPAPPIAPPVTPPTPYAPPRPQPPVSGGYNQMNEGAGETSVLNEGAGETTVLGGQRAGGFALVRKSNGQKVAINKPDFTIGKERRRVDYCISDNSSISRAHARIKVRSGKCYICDLGSTNCTFVNGNKLTPNQEVELNRGDSVKFADEEFVFEG